MRIADNVVWENARPKFSHVEARDKTKSIHSLYFICKRTDQ